MNKQSSIELNCDMGEGFGRWKCAPDEELMPFISAANIACGFHAGDPRIMRRTVKKAVELGLHVGAHVSLPDIIGFGRRRMAISPEEMRDNTLYQIGALKAFVEAEGGKLSHVKPHGVMYVMLQEDEALAEAAISATAEVDKNLLFYALDDKNEALAKRHGIKLIPEGFVDLNYDHLGNLLIEKVKVSWDPEKVARRAVQMVSKGTIDADDGSVLSMKRSTICLHGDADNSLDVVRTVKQRLNEAGIEVRPLVH